MTRRSIVLAGATALALAGACAAPAGLSTPTALLAPAPSTSTAQVAQDRFGLLVDAADLPDGFACTRDRVIESREVAADDQELQRMRELGRLGGWERTFVAESERDDGIAFAITWVSEYLTADGAAWAMDANANETRAAATAPLTSETIGELGDAALAFGSVDDGAATQVTLIYFRTRRYANGVVVAGSDRAATRDLALAIAHRQLERQTRVALSASR